MRTRSLTILTLVVPVALAVLQSCAGETPTAASRGELGPAGAQPHMFVAHLEVVWDDPNAEKPQVNGGLVQVKVFQEENEFEFSARAVVPNPGDVLNVAGGAVFDPSGGVLFELEDGCRSCPPVEHVVFLDGSATLGPDLATDFFQDAEDFDALVFFEGGMFIGSFKEIPIPEAPR